MLRCRENDLAVILTGPYLGYTITVGKFVGAATGIDPNGCVGVSENCWEIKGIDMPNTPAVLCEDHHLQPIRGNTNNH